MASPSNHWKLGLFVVAGVVLGIGSLIFLGAQSLNKDTVTYTSFFDESVQGLEVGSPVKFRGVTIGNVAKIAIATDRRHVTVEQELNVEDITAMGLAEKKGKDLRIAVPDDLRVQLASQGLTGVKFVQMDFFPVESNPPLKLPFETPPNYIPAAQSVMKNLEDSVVNAVNRIPEAADQALEIMKQINGMLGQLEAIKVPQKADDTLKRANSVLSTLERTLTGLQTEKLSTQAQQTLAEVALAVKNMNELLARASGQDGLVASAEKASFAVSEAALSAAGTTQDLGATLRAVQDAAASIQRLTDALERDSDMLIKGRSRKESR